jgi:hypothetical protein
MADGGRADRRIAGRHDPFRGLRFRALTFLLLALVPLGPAAAQVPDGKDLTLAEREHWRKQLGWPDEFESQFSETRAGDGGGMRFYSLGAGRHLAEIMIFPGAYQPGYIYMLYDEAKRAAVLLTFRHYERGERERVRTYSEPEIAGLPEFDAKRGTLRMFTKSRGPGDCGSLVTYEFSSGKAVPVEARARACDDQRPPVVDPEKWPKVEQLRP